MREKVESILVETGFADNRAAKMDVDDLLKYVSHPFSRLHRFALYSYLHNNISRLLAAFNLEGM